MKTEETFFAGTIVEILDPVLYEIKVDIPGVIEGVKAFPVRGEIDEPRVGDFVVLLSLDPVYHSYYLYKKIKENDFIGFRSNGKMIDVTPEAITIGIFDQAGEYSDKEGEVYRPEITDWIKIDSEGNMDINMRTNSTINIAGGSTINITGKSTVNIESDSNVTISGNSTVDVSGDNTITAGSNVSLSISGNADISVSGNTTLDSPTVTITGGTLKVTGTSSTSMDGPFNCIPTCPFSGAPHSGSTVTGT